MEKPNITPGKFCCLVVEDNLPEQMFVSRVLKKGLPDALILAARTVKEAETLMSEYQVHFFILDIHLPDGSGLDLLCDIQTVQPDAAVVITTATQLPQYRTQAESQGVLRFLEKPIKTDLLVGLVRDRKQALDQAASTGNTEQFSAALSRLSSIDIIQLKCLTGATQVLEFTAPSHGVGKVYFERGEIVHAETPKARGPLAFYDIIGWRGGRVTEVSGTEILERSIATNWQMLLLEAAQFNDEHNPSEPASLQP